MTYTGRHAAPRTRGASLWMASVALRVLERFRQSAERLLEQSGSFRAGGGNSPHFHFHVRPPCSDHEDFLRALQTIERLTTGSRRVK